MSHKASSSTQRDEPPQEDGTDGWVTPPVSYVEPRRIFCALCGRPIARRYWQTASKTPSLTFCDPAHANLYATYWLPLYGEQGKS